MDIPKIIVHIDYNNKKMTNVVHTKKGSNYVKVQIAQIKYMKIHAVEYNIQEKCGDLIFSSSQSGFCRTNNICTSRFRFL